MISKETEERLKDGGFVFCDIYGTSDADKVINVTLDAIDEYEKENPQKLKLAYLRYVKETRELRIAGKDVSNRLTYEEFKEKWLNENS